MKFLSWLLGPKKPEYFAARILRDLIRQFPNSTWVFQKDQFAIVDKTRNGHQINLHNFYAEYIALPYKNRDSIFKAILASRIAGETGLPEELSEARSHIMPKIWSRAAIDRLHEQQRRSQAKKPSMPLIPVGEHFYLSVVYDTETAMRSLNVEDLESWGLTTYEALEIARENIEKQTVGYSKMGEVLYTYLGSDSYNAARLVLMDQIKSFEIEGDGETIAFIPNRDSLHVTGTNSDVGIGIALDLAAETIRQPRPLLITPLVLRDEEWVDWEIPSSHAMYSKVKHLQRLSMSSLYKDQADELNAGDGNIHQAFAASVIYLQGEDENSLPITAASVTRGIKTLLPEVDRVIFFDPETNQVVAHGTWERMIDTAKDLISKLDDYYPSRYLMTEFPDAQTLEKIGLLPMPGK